jgi:hypothetical protein
VSKFKGKIHQAAQKHRSLLAGLSNLKAHIDEDLLVFNFKFFDPSQGQGFDEWAKEGLLAQTLEMFKEYSRQLVPACFSARFKCYDAMPRDSEFRHPRHVPEDATWASMHLQGLPCIIGHMYRNVFYVVFLDRHHKFWPSDIQDRGKVKR